MLETVARVFSEDDQFRDAVADFIATALLANNLITARKVFYHFGIGDIPFAAILPRGSHPKALLPSLVFQVPACAWIEYRQLPHRHTLLVEPSTAVKTTSPDFHRRLSGWNEKSCSTLAIFRGSRGSPMG